MMKIAIPVLLVSIVMIAGIFAFMPVDKATTVHTTIQGTQLNNVESTFQTDLKANATAGCGSSGGSFLVHYTFTNASLLSSVEGYITTIAIDDLKAAGHDFIVNLVLQNQTSISGITAGTTGETITFSGGTNLEDTGAVGLTVVCQSGSTPALSP